MCVLGGNGHTDISVDSIYGILQTSGKADW